MKQIYAALLLGVTLSATIINPALGECTNDCKNYCVDKEMVFIIYERETCTCQQKGNEKGLTSITPVINLKTCAPLNRPSSPDLKDWERVNRRDAGPAPRLSTGASDDDL